jgi:prepilin signal peptidase PulO-like enzyme (type II secretory pathway)
MQCVQNLPTWYLIVVGGLFGAILASFTMVVVERVPRGESVNGRSRCVCGRQLRAWENVPILGWLISGGQARCCGTRIPARLLYAECAGAGAMAAAAAVGTDAVIGVAVLWVIAVTVNTRTATKRERKERAENHD